ncbi:hypothetical protein AMEX_G27545 [Astyanax mexicanus]|uniref:Uncharacterized protein n=1 Tax=Astyanax mexicanus TaxID=7994 RepID=A0A8T2KKM5_ASTMX|nr:hypothetical protein AMEX_G27545 [Astyanax mexicanus]
MLLPVPFLSVEKRNAGLSSAAAFNPHLANHTIRPEILPKRLSLPCKGDQKKKTGGPLKLDRRVEWMLVWDGAECCFIAKV